MTAEAEKGDQRALAVALKYTPGDSAPTVVAKGRGLVAAEIIARAHEHGVYVHESPELVALLSQVNLDDQIPPQLYIAVAELLAWLYALDSEGPASASMLRQPVMPGAPAVPTANVLG